MKIQKYFIVLIFAPAAEPVRQWDFECRGAGISTRLTFFLFSFLNPRIPKGGGGYSSLSLPSNGASVQRQRADEIRTHAHGGRCIV